MNDYEQRVASMVASMSDVDYRVHVAVTLTRVESGLAEIKKDQAELDKKHEILRNRVEAQGRDVARLQVKAGAWGAISGLVAGVLAAMGIR